MFSAWSSCSFAVLFSSWLCSETVTLWAVLGVEGIWNNLQIQSRYDVHLNLIHVYDNSVTLPLQPRRRSLTDSGALGFSRGGLNANYRWNHVFRTTSWPARSTSGQAIVRLGRPPTVHGSPSWPWCVWRALSPPGRSCTAGPSSPSRGCRAPWTAAARSPGRGTQRDIRQWITWIAQTWERHS